MNIEWQSDTVSAAGAAWTVRRDDSERLEERDDVRGDGQLVVLVLHAGAGAVGVHDRVLAVEHLLVRLVEAHVTAQHEAGGDAPAGRQGHADELLIGAGARAAVVDEELA